jgi:hypothetical protein
MPACWETTRQAGGGFPEPSAAHRSAGLPDAGGVPLRLAKPCRWTCALQKPQAGWPPPLPAGGQHFVTGADAVVGASSPGAEPERRVMRSSGRPCEYHLPEPATAVFNLGPSPPLTAPNCRGRAAGAGLLSDTAHMTLWHDPALCRGVVRVHSRPLPSPPTGCWTGC